MMVLLSVLLFLSLLVNAVLGYLYYTDDTYQMVGFLPERWIQNKDRFYLFLNNTKDWFSSRERCQDLGGDLVIINSIEEQEFLAQQIVSSDALVLHWIGLTDRQTEGTWLWVDNTPLNINLSWWVFPPDDYDVHDPSGEDCAVLNGYLRGEKWGDISCLKKERSICEIPFS
ncbi:C-type lectin domain family 4 member E-like [Pseudorasbora parva]|uniref:C-type lectin domain family 4 member E-like n=1 Tax=Pseudorasbora parva TaxID=51549 RepID=UPI00351DE476